jgi:hypothetical protein
MHGSQPGFTLLHPYDNYLNEQVGNIDSSLSALQPFTAIIHTLQIVDFSLNCVSASDILKWYNNLLNLGLMSFHLCFIFTPMKL